MLIRSRGEESRCCGTANALSSGVKNNNNKKQTKKLPIAVGLLKWNVLTYVQHLRGVFYYVFMRWRFILSKNWQLF